MKWKDPWQTRLVRFVERIMRRIGMHVHDRRLFCFGNIAVVKCVGCGMESIPWEVKPEHAEAWRKTHPTAAEEYIEIDRVRRG